MAEIEDHPEVQGDPVQVIINSGVQLAAQGAKLAEALRCLDSSLPNIRSMCGNDDAGRDLAAKLGLVAEQLQAFVDSMSKGLDSDDPKHPGAGQVLMAMVKKGLVETDRASTV